MSRNLGALKRLDSSGPVQAWTGNGLPFTFLLSLNDIRVFSWNVFGCYFTLYSSKIYHILITEILLTALGRREAFWEEFQVKKKRLLGLLLAA